MNRKRDAAAGNVGTHSWICQSYKFGLSRIAEKRWELEHYLTTKWLYTRLGYIFEDMGVSAHCTAFKNGVMHIKIVCPKGKQSLWKIESTRTDIVFRLRAFVPRISDAKIFVTDVE